MTVKNLCTFGFVAVFTACSLAARSESPHVDYPQHYRSWGHVKTAIINAEHPLADLFGGIHHIYGNTEALAGLRSGRYKKGAVLVFDLLHLEEQDNVLVESGRKRVDVMQYDPDSFVSTGGWGYATFVGGSHVERLDQDVATACHSCHQAAKSTGYVYSKYRE